MKLLLFIFLSVVEAFAQAIPGRYIVQLSGSPAGEVQAALIRAGKPGRRSSQVLARQKEIATAQAGVRAAVSKRGARVLGSADTAANVLFIQADAATAESLRGLSGISRVVPDSLVFARLNRALPLSNFTNAAARVGIGNAGAGMLIAVIDTGIDTSHPGFSDDTLVPPAGFPVASSTANQALVTKKVIVVRSYEDIAASAAFGTDASDKNGHGTSSACAAGCVQHTSPIGVISSAAPKAFLGAYKALGDNGSGPTSAILKAIDDAVKDYADVLNLSLGSELTGDPAADLKVQALNLAADAGVVIVCAAGNEGPDHNSIDSPGFAEKVIAVGSSSSDRSIGSDATFTSIDPNRISGFSSRGPSVANILKPDMVSVGDNFYLAASTVVDPAIFYKVTQGTSFASPTVAGAAAFIKSARPGLTAAQYRSLLVNSTSTLFLASGAPIAVRSEGSGRLNIGNSLDQLIALSPVSLNFGRGGDVNIMRDITVTNLAAVPVNVAVSVVPFDGRVAPQIVSAPNDPLAPGASATVTFSFSGTDLSGEYQGAIVIANDSNQLIAHASYLYSVPSTIPASITVFQAPDSAAAGSTATFFVRVVDAAGNEIADPQLTVTPTSGGGSVVGTAPVADLIALFAVQVTMGGKSDNVFTITDGNVSRSVTISLQ
jgi:subtilisin family serine protease